MGIPYAAHVDCPISHHGETAQISAGAIGILITLSVVATGGAAGLVGVVATATGLAITGGGFVDAMLPMNTGAGKIVSGLPVVLLGPHLKPAARAQAEDTRSGECHVDKMFDGSKTVMIGDGIRPMSRSGDRVGPACGGTIFDGLHSLMVGGERSQEGVALSEQDSDLLRVIKLTADALGGTANVVKGAAVQGLTQLAAVALAADGHGDAANLLKLAAFRTGDLTGGTLVERTIGATDAGNNLVQAAKR